MNRLSLAEELYVLCCEPDHGRLRIAGTHLALGLGGALLLDLVRHGRVTLVDEHVAVVDRAPLGEPLLDEALDALAAEGRPHEPDHWVRHLSHGARAAVEHRLVERGFLHIEQHRVLGLVPVRRCHQTDGRLGHELLDRLRDAVVLDRQPTAETAALVSIVLAVGLERHLFPRSDLRALRHRMREIAEGEWVGAAVRHNIDAVNAALGIQPVDATDEP